MPTRIMRAVYTGDTADLEAANKRAASSVGAAGDQITAALGKSTESYARLAAASQSSSDKLILNVRNVAKASLDEAAKMGLSVDEQVASAAKASAAWTSAYGDMSAAQRAAGTAALRAAKDVGASVDEQAAAYGRAIAAQGELEAAAKAAADAQVEASSRATAAAKAAADAQVSAAKKMAAAKDASTAGVSAAGGTLLGKAGKFGALAAGAAVVGTAYEGVKGIVSLQKQMEMLKTQAGASQAQVNSLTKSILNMAGSVGTGPQDLAQGMYHVVSSLNATLPVAQRTSDEMNVLKVAAEGAKVGNANLVDVTNALDAAVVSGIHGVQNYSQAMGSLNSIVGAGDMTMQDLSEAMGTGVLANAQLAGVSIKQLGGAIAVLGDNNIRGAKAGTLLSSTLRIMKAPSEAAAGVLKDVGLSSTQLASDMRSGGLIKALDDLRTHLQESGATASQQGIILTRAFGGRQSNGISILLSQLDRLKSKTEQVGQGADSFSKDYAATTDTLSFKLDQLKATVSALADKFGSVLLPALTSTVGAISSMIGWMDRHRQAAQLLADVIGSVLGAAILGFAGAKAAAFVSGISEMRGAMSVMSGDSTSLATAMAAKFGLINVAAKGTATEMGATADAVGAADGTMASETTAAAGEMDVALGSTGIGLVIVGLGTAATEMAEHWSTVMDGMKSAAQAMVSAVRAAMNGVVSALNVAISVFNDTIGHLTGDIGKLNKFTAGGSNIVAQNVAGDKDKGSAGSGLVDLSVNASQVAKANVPGLDAAQKQVAATVVATLEKGGLSAAGAAAVAGNWVQESSLNPNSNGPNGTGLGQWTGGRATALQTFAQQQGTPWNSASTQANFALQELQSDPTLLNALKSNGDPKALALAVSNMFEEDSSTAPGAGLYTAPLTSTAYQREGNVPGREAYAQDIFTGLGGKLDVSSGSAPKGGVNLHRLSAALNSMLNGTGASSTTKAALNTGEVGTGINSAISKYQGLGSTAQQEGNSWLATAYKSVVTALQALGKQLDPKASAAKTAAQLDKIDNSMKAQLAAIEAHGETLAALATKLGTYQTSASSLIAKLSNATQNGTVTSLEKDTGVTTGGKVSATLRGKIEKLGSNASGSAISNALSPTLQSASAGSQQEKAMNKLVSELRSVHSATLNRLADQVVAAHKAALAALGQQMYAKQATADAATLTLQTTAMQDQTQKISDAQANQLAVMKDMAQKVSDAMQGATTALKDSATLMSDKMAGAAQAISDSTQLMSDASNAQVEAIQDQSQIKIDTTDEKGLYGMALIAQQLQVTADTDKAYYDQQIAIAQQTLDTTKATWDAQVSAAQTALDQTQLTQDQLVNAAQQHDDTVQVVQDARISRAMAHADAVVMQQDILVQTAQNTVNADANSPKSVQAAAQAALTKAQAVQAKAVGEADSILSKVTSNANQAIQQANDAFTNASNQAASLIAQGQQALSSAQAQASSAIATATQNLTTISDTAAQVEATDSGNVGQAQAVSQTQYAGSGLVVNMYGLNPSDASANASELGWLLRTQIQA